MRHIIWLLAAALLTGCRASPTPAPTQHQSAATTGLATGLYWQPSAKPGNRWALLLPGASGLSIFNDHDHYFRIAKSLNERGIDVLIADYKRAYRAAPNRPNVDTGAKIAWVVSQSIAWAHEHEYIHADEPGIIIAWSLGAQGLFEVLKDPSMAPGLRAAAAYYPANEDHHPITTTVPLLLLTGEADDVTPAAELRGALTPSPLIELHTYPGAHHGFDITSLQQPRTVRLLPLIGPSGTFAHDPQAASDAWSRLTTFLDAHVHSR
ncbi:MAG: dienelactone hydrolase family protein [Planctomycetota bacterium]|nr:dienelactone hydrolase family protein [Planctomycetota bacterium]